ncbi:hypothetical protein F2P56_034255 [Juglans regia]|uniref:HAT C-terminal dimerisation domain-containing protein n=1 Tax=Juglans regia TaxID=51240 RepID=A0A833TDN7_JUGRE|nr:hypothetical protein F2P56_034255 [Juglans regia]
MVYGLGIAYKQAWLEHIAARVRKILVNYLMSLPSCELIILWHLHLHLHLPPPVPEAGIGKRCRLDWDERLEQNPFVRSSTKAQSEIDRYLAAELEPFSRDFDILSWWRVEGVKYFVLGGIARSILVVSISTVASELIFSTRGRVLDSFRNSLAPTTMKALICTQNWTTKSPIHVLDVLHNEEVDVEKESGDQPGSVIYETTSMATFDAV